MGAVAFATHGIFLGHFFLVVLVRIGAIRAAVAPIVAVGVAVEILVARAFFLCWWWALELHEILQH